MAGGLKSEGRAREERGKSEGRAREERGRRGRWLCYLEFKVTSTMLTRSFNANERDAQLQAPRDLQLSPP